VSAPRDPWEELAPALGVRREDYRRAMATPARARRSRIVADQDRQATEQAGQRITPARAFAELASSVLLWGPEAGRATRDEDRDR
jgi:hypothetical protein